MILSQFHPPSILKKSSPKICSLRVSYIISFSFFQASVFLDKASKSIIQNLHSNRPVRILSSTLRNVTQFISAVRSKGSSWKSAYILVNLLFYRLISWRLVSCKFINSLHEETSCEGSQTHLRNSRNNTNTSLRTKLIIYLLSVDNHTIHINDLTRHWLARMVQGYILKYFSAGRPLMGHFISLARSTLRSWCQSETTSIEQILTCQSAFDFISVISDINIVTTDMYITSDINIPRKELCRCDWY